MLHFVAIQFNKQKLFSLFFFMNGLAFTAEVPLGIDLGTTNSCAHSIRNGRPFPISDKNGKVIVPSCVNFRTTGIVVGEAARRGKESSMCMNAKRLIGRKWDNEFIQLMKDRCNATICEDNGFPVFDVEGRHVTPTEVSEHIIRHLITLSEEQLGKKITKLIVTVPAYFNMDQRNATREAAKNATSLDSESVFIINEPTAAAISYNLPTSKKEKIVMVYDLGGGTFDISLIKVEKRVVTVLATGGNNKLGGDDFTAKVANILCQLYAQVNGGMSLLPEDNPTNHKMYVKCYKRLLEVAEDVKINLKNTPQISVDLSPVNPEREPSTVVITENLMEEALRPHIDETLSLMDEVLKQKNMTKDDIDYVLLVGGSSKLNMVKRMMCEKFGADKVSAELDPDRCVSEGAMLFYKEFGAQITDKNFSTVHVGAGDRVRTVGKTLKEIVNISLGTRVGKEHRNDIMIPKGTPVPGEFSKTYSVPDYQTSVHDALFQGEAEFTKDCEEVAPIVYGGITPRPSGQIQLKYTFLVDYGGMVRVTVEELPGNRILYGPKLIQYEKSEHTE